MGAFAGDFLYPVWGDEGVLDAVVVDVLLGDGAGDFGGGEPVDDVGAEDGAEVREVGGVEGGRVVDGAVFGGEDDAETGGAAGLGAVVVVESGEEAAVGEVSGEEGAGLEVVGCLVPDFVHLAAGLESGFGEGVGGAASRD